MRKTIGIMCLIATLGLVVVGCSKKENSSPPPAAPTKTTSTVAEKAAQQAGQDVNQVVQTVKQVAAEQTICPVMKGPINKEIFAEYKGKMVYFCCADCKATFEKDPEKYVKDLPQFIQ